MAKARSLLLSLLILILSSIPLACFTAWFMNSRSDRIVKQWHQPKEVDYKRFDPYTLSVLEGAIEWNALHLPRRHYLFIGRGTDAPDYGYYQDYTFHAGIKEIDEYIGRSTVEWTPEGVSFLEASGQRLFVPKALFIGGR